MARQVEIIKISPELYKNKHIPSVNLFLVLSIFNEY